MNTFTFQSRFKPGDILFDGRNRWKVQSVYLKMTKIKHEVKYQIHKLMRCGLYVRKESELQSFKRIECTTKSPQSSVTNVDES